MKSLWISQYHGLYIDTAVLEDLSGKSERSWRAKVSQDECTG